MSRRVLALTGADRIEFLQDLVTNDIRPEDRLTYAALLSPQGKYLFDFLVSHDGERLLIDVAEDMAEALAARLTMYRLRRKVGIETTDLRVFRGTGTPPEDALPDPRHEALGWRRYDSDGADDGKDWDALRVTHTVPESGIELVPNDSYILEMGFDRLHGVDFKKGCYVGQEVTARMKHKTELKKGLVTVDVDGMAPVGTPILNGEREVGTLFTQSGGRGLAWLRFDKAGTDMVAGEARVSWTR